MNSRICRLFAGICVLAMAAIWAVPAGAQMSEVKEKPPMYSYVADWIIPRAHWADMDKSFADDAKVLDKAMADGTIVAYGYDVTLVHTAEGATHDDWWSSMSLAGVFNTLDRFYASGSVESPVLESATKHWDSVYVARYYNWHSGPVKNGYGVASFFKLKEHAPDNALSTLSKGLVGPLLEKMLADGTISEWEIDTQAFDTEAPGTFVIYYIANNADAMDKVNAAIQEDLKSNPLAGPAFGSAVNSSSSRDEVTRSTATYK
ncbi:MAG TPA: hypothetical protein VKS44_09110 [Candidatus Acidoferrales bacterium]|nr:hypothetical protein [Candidatus Acidoferrales bacterium]